MPFPLLQSPGMAPPGQRITLMFSATFPREVQSVARELLSPQHAFVTVGFLGGANSDIVQTIMPVGSGGSKKDMLLEMLQQDIQSYVRDGQ